GRAEALPLQEPQFRTAVLGITTRPVPVPGEHAEVRVQVLRQIRVVPREAVETGDPIGSGVLVPLQIQAGSGVDEDRPVLLERLAFRSLPGGSVDEAGPGVAVDGRIKLDPSTFGDGART